MGTERVSRASAVNAALPDVKSTSRYLNIDGGGEGCPATCHAPIGAGKSVTLTFTISVPDSFSGSKIDFYVHPSGVNDLGALVDPNYTNNDVKLAVQR